MDLDETEVRNDCAGEDQQQFKHPTDKESWTGLRNPGIEHYNLETAVRESSS
jgi:hypothetical protein